METRDGTAGGAPGDETGRPGDDGGPGAPGPAPGGSSPDPGEPPGDDGGRSADAALVAAARAGDGAAFGRLFDRWFDPVYDVAWRIVRDRDTAAEVAQDVFLAAWQGLDRLEQPGSFGGWVRRIARNRALNRLERERRSRPDVERVAAVLDRSPGDVDMTATLSEREQHELVWAAAGALGERDASLLDLHLRHGLGAAAIAEELGVTANNAHQLLHRLRGKLAGAIRAWVLWRAGEGRCAGLDRALAAGGLTTFGPEAVRVIGRHAEGCGGCGERQRLRLAPEALFSAMPIMIAPPLVRAEAAAALAEAGVPMAGSAAAPAATPGPGRGPGEGVGAGEGPDVGSGDPGEGAGGPAGTGGEPATSRRRRAALVAGVAGVLLALAGVAGMALGGDGGDGDAVDAAGAAGSSPAAEAAGRAGDGEARSGPGGVAARPGTPKAPPVPPSDAPASTAGGGTQTTGTSPPAPDGEPGGDPGPPADGDTTPPTDAEPPVIGGFRASLGESCGSSAAERLVHLAWQSTGADAATVEGPGGTTAHPASGTTSRCVTDPAASFTLTVTGPGGEATATASARAAG
ncbi:MAG TPA: sigma-70 family RNA polymerase sigma factor [Acidimicrobiales bacterium]